MRLHDLKMSSNAKRVRVTAFELNLPLELVPVNPQAGENRRPEYLGKNPMGKVPTFEDGDFVLWESLAIMEYLCSKAPGQTLLPADARAHAEVQRWLFFSSQHIQPWQGVVGSETWLKPMRGEPTNEGALEYARTELKRFLPVLDEQLANRESLTGAFSLADIGVGCTLERLVTLKYDLSGYKNVVRWIERLQQRPAWQKAA